MLSVLIFLSVSIVAGIPIFIIYGIHSKRNNEQKELIKAWESGDFETTYTMSQSALEEKPMDYFLLTVHGFSAFQLGVSQINNSDTLIFIDDSIWSLRKALLIKDSGKDGQIYYVLGKAYYYKGDDYADLAIEYLEKARNISYEAADIPEYLGLSYARTGDYRSSVQAFSQALSPSDSRPSDLLLLAIARSYASLNELESAKAYLIRCIEVSRDSITTVTAQLFLAGILTSTGDTDGAEKQYLEIIELSGDNAEAYYQLGEIYLQRGDIVRARAQWRLALRTDPGHAKARARIYP